MTTETSEKRLCKSRTDRMIDGVCGGVARYFGLDPTLVRISWVLLTLLGGSGIILYIVAMIIMPAEPVTLGVATAPPIAPVASKTNHRFWGILLIVLGLIWFVDNLGFPFWHHWWGLSWGSALSVALILIGVAFIFGGRSYVAPSSSTEPVAGGEQPGATPEDSGTSKPSTRLFKSRFDKKLAGVCGGLATHLGVDSTVVRLVFVIAALASLGFAVLAYVILAIVIPKETATPGIA